MPASAFSTGMTLFVRQVRRSRCGLVIVDSSRLSARRCVRQLHPDIAMPDVAWRFLDGSFLISKCDEPITGAPCRSSARKSPIRILLLIVHPRNFDVRPEHPPPPRVCHTSDGLRNQHLQEERGHGRRPGQVHFGPGRPPCRLVRHPHGAVLVVHPG